jgi:ketosteroid isomerase-like protein
MAAVDDIRTLTDKFVAAFNEGDPGPFVAALDDDLEVFDHAAYRFDDKPSFLAYLQASMASADGASLVYHQGSYRALGDDAGVFNGYDAFTVKPKGGGAPTTAYGRTTYVYARRGRDWKIVSAHFSPLPK